MLTKHGDYIFDGQYKEAREVITPVDVTPCAKWVARGDKEWSIVDDLSIIIPPWDFTWAEYYAVRGPLERVGVLCSYIEWEEFQEWDGRVPYKLKASYEQETIKWVVWYRVYISIKSTCLFVATLFHGLNEAGQAETSRSICQTTEEFENHFSDVRDAKRRDMITPLFTPVQLGMSLCHANNVEIYEDSVPDPVQKKRRKSGKNPGKTFKCLDIEPMKKQSRRESEEGESDVERALHICRGHFKTYTEENPLFGQHTGTYWWPMHVRGSEDAGEVEKSYSVNPPTQ